MNSQRNGILLALSSAILFGAGTPLAKLLLAGMGPTTLAGLLYCGAGAGMALALTGRALLKLPRTEAPLTRADWPWLAGVVIAGGVVGPILLMLGLRTTAAASAALLLNLESLLTLLIAWLAFHENVDRRVGLGALAILGGAVLLSWQGRFGGWQLGALAVVGACLAWAVDNNLTRKLANADPIDIVLVKGWVAGPVSLAIAVLIGERLPTIGFIVAAGVLGAITYGGSLIAFVLALRALGTARTGAYFATAPFLGAALSVLLLEEPLTWPLIAAGGLMVVGVYLHLTERHHHLHVHSAMAHNHRHSHDPHHQHAHGPTDPAGEPHTHHHVHPRLEHSHSHYPDIHHQHRHGDSQSSA